jgi:hypothetical protein
MNKKIIFGIVCLGVIIVLMIIFFMKPQLNDVSNDSSKKIQIKETTKEPVELALELKDLPEGYFIAEKSERLKSDISERGLSLGWIKGYQVKFRKGESLFDFTNIVQWISFYPLENISKNLEFEPEPIEGWSFEKMPELKIGDASRSYRWTDLEYGDIEYEIEFIKKNVYVRISMFGSSTDYELLKDLTKKIEEKI